jgi:hypothetical protein
MRAQQHWHGFGPWTGQSATLKDEGPRRPGPDPAALQAFLANDLPAMQTGHYLLRRRAVSADRTWITVEGAMRWLTQQYAAHPPIQDNGEHQAYVDLQARINTTCDGLMNGVDAVWWYYTAGFSVAISAVVCCPHAHLKQIPCPLPPS